MGLEAEHTNGGRLLDIQNVGGRMDLNPSTIDEEVDWLEF